MKTNKEGKQLGVSLDIQEYFLRHVKHGWEEQDCFVGSIFHGGETKARRLNKEEEKAYTRPEEDFLHFIIMPS